MAQDPIDQTINSLHDAGASDAEITAILQEKFGGAKIPQETQPSSGGLALAVPTVGAPVLRAGVAGTAKFVAESPNLQKFVGRGVHAAAGAVLGRMVGSPAAGAAVGAAIPAAEAGEMVGNAAQAVSNATSTTMPRVAGKFIKIGMGRKAVNAASSLALKLAPLSGAMSVGDLAQMADPTRRDIGTLGVGPTVHVKGEHPALLNALYEALRARLQRKP